MNQKIPRWQKGCDSYVNERIYSKRNSEDGVMEWFFYSREGDMGPFQSYDIALKNISRHIERCRRSNLDGGRGFEAARINKLGECFGRQTHRLTLIPFD